jgi:hypothetical protein
METLAIVYLSITFDIRAAFEEYPVIKKYLLSIRLPYRLQLIAALAGHRKLEKTLGRIHKAQRKSTPYNKRSSVSSK